MNLLSLRDFRKIIHHFRGIYGIYLKLMKKTRTMDTTCNQLNLETLGFWPLMSRKSPQTLISNSRWDMWYFHIVSVSAPDWVTYHNGTHLSDEQWCGSKNGDQNDTCLKDIGLHAPTLFTILDSIIRNRLIVEEGPEGYMIIYEEGESLIQWWIRFSHELEKLQGKWL